MLNDFIFVQKKAYSNTFKKIKFIPILMLHLIVYNLIYLGVSILIAKIFGRSLFIGSLLAYIVKVFISSACLYVLGRIVMDNNLKLLEVRDFLDNGKKFLSPLFTAFFSYYIIELLVALVSSPNSGLAGNIIITFLLYITFSAVLESIYISGHYSYDAINHGITFIVENFVNWFIPNTLIFLFFYFIFDQILVFPNLILNLRLGSRFAFMRTLNNYMIGQLLAILILSFVLVFKGELYKILAFSNRRKRSYNR